MSLKNIEPFARLITMLGDQLITNEEVAVSELVKNSYDADAFSVSISFEGFQTDFDILDPKNFGLFFSMTPESKIVISDNGFGMTEKGLEEGWLYPATPIKLKAKKKQPRTPLGRFIQGEKGIGRFAVFKLGKCIRIFSRRQLSGPDGTFLDAGSEIESCLTYDFSQYDDDFLTKNGTDQQILLKDLSADVTSGKPDQISGVLEGKTFTHGTVIEISHLKGRWSIDKINRIQKTLSKMLPVLFDTKYQQSDFSFSFYFGDKLIPFENPSESIARLIESNKPILKISGAFNSRAKEYDFSLNGEERTLSFTDPQIRGLSKFPALFPNADQNELNCGDYLFEFFIFDLRSGLNCNFAHYLDKDEKDLVRDHRIYVYRDKVRVMPYGDADDDWLQIDTLRGTERANAFASNDQTIGCVYISEKDNPRLRDQTNREGLIEDDSAFSDFRGSLQLFLRWVAAYPLADYLRETKKQKQSSERLEEELTIKAIQKAKDDISMGKDANAALLQIEKSYSEDVKTYLSRIELVDRLAAVGMSVETTTHDVAKIVGETWTELDSIVHGKNESIQKDPVLKEQLEKILSFLQTCKNQITRMGILFPSTKREKSDVVVRDVANQIADLYGLSFGKDHINFDYESPFGPLVVETIDAVLMQVLLNLFDNAEYWLNTNPKNQESKKILIVENSKNRTLVFADNGPGISKEDYSKIFEPFFTRKGLEGHGLGLYIARQLLERCGFQIELLTNDSDKILSGANFCIFFDPKMGGLK